jgi:hypothetical protein
MHGTADKITDPALVRPADGVTGGSASPASPPLARACQSKQFFDAAASTDKTYTSYPGGYHELFTEPDGCVHYRCSLVGWRAVSEGGGASESRRPCRACSMGDQARDAFIAWIVDRSSAVAKL